MLRQRLITGVIMAAVVIAFTMLSPQWLVLGVFGSVVVVASWEWAAFAGLRTMPSRVVYALAPALVMGLLWGAVTGNEPRTDVVELILLFSVGFWLAAIVFVVLYPRFAKVWGSRLMLMIIGLSVLIPPWVALALITAMPGGRLLAIYCIAAIAFADIGAYFAGSHFGGPKLMPAVSPKKTVSGVVGGLLLSTVFALVCGLGAGLPAEQVPGWLLIAFVAALVSVFGDLLESMAKRQCGIKDSGSILPGHGGIFDRVDSLSAGLPFYAIGLSLVGGFWQ